MKVFLKRIAWWLAVVSGTIWATLLLSTLIYPAFMWMEDLPQLAGMSAGRLYANYAYLIGYLHQPFANFALPDFPFSVAGASHFADVRTLILLDVAIFLLTLPFAWRFYAGLRRAHRRFVLRRSILVGASLPLILTALMAINFDAVFVTFHHLLFRNSDWLFDPSVDPIITVLPEEFFAACFLLAIVLFEIVMFMVWHAGKKDALRDLAGDQGER